MLFLRPSSVTWCPCCRQFDNTLPQHPKRVSKRFIHSVPRAQLFDKTVRALESAVNRLPGMHDMGLENLLLEEPPPPTPTTPAAGATTPGGAAAAAAAAAATAAAAAAAARGIRPTAPGKSSIPWAHDAIGPLSQLARQVRNRGNEHEMLYSFDRSQSDRHLTRSSPYREGTSRRCGGCDLVGQFAWSEIFFPTSVEDDRGTFQSRATTHIPVISLSLSFVFAKMSRPLVHTIANRRRFKFSC